jgi:hypothetical protein
MNGGLLFQMFGPGTVIRIMSTVIPGKFLLADLQNTISQVREKKEFRVKNVENKNSACQPVFC